MQMQATTLYSLITQAHKDKVQAYIQSAEQQGAKIVVDGREVKPAGYEKGFFVGPTLIDQVTPNMTSYQQEILVLCCKLCV